MNRPRTAAAGAALLVAAGCSTAPPATASPPPASSGVASARLAAGMPTWPHGDAGQGRAPASSSRLPPGAGGAGEGAVVLANPLVERRWKVLRGPLGGYATTSLRDVITGAQWSTAASPDFSLTVDGVALTSSHGWGDVGVRTATLAGGATEVTFDLRTPAASAIDLEVIRSYTLHPDAAVVEVRSTLIDRGPTPLRVGAYSLDELTSASGGGVEVHAYRGGSDNQDTFRAVATETTTFDDEGEVLRVDAGSGGGWFSVSERRGGLMNRASRTAPLPGLWRTAVGVDPARDLVDLGPVDAPDSNDNRVGNPAHPAPARQRTVPAGGILDLGRADTGVYHGGIAAAAATFAADFDAHRRAPVVDSIDQNTFHPFGHGPQLSDAPMRAQADAAKALGIETFMLDDQWQGSSSGDWRFDPARFPDSDGDGVPDVVDHLHGIGMNLGLWMSPLEFNPSSQAYRAHPDWACAPTGDVSAQIPSDAGLGVWDVTNPRFRAYITGVVDRAVARWGVTEFKFDFMTWVDCPPHDYLDYEDAFVTLVEQLQARHPGVTFELDETNDQRCWPFESAVLGQSWFDNDHTHGSTVVARQLHDLWSAAPWVPPSSLGLGLYDGTLSASYPARYLMSIAMLSHVTVWTDTTRIPAADAVETSWWLHWYRAHRGELGGVVLEDTGADPIDGTSWVALQPWSGDHGYLFVFRQGGGDASRQVPLQGLDPRRSYRITDVRTGIDMGTAAGSALTAGYSVSLPQRYTSLVAAVTPV